MAYRLLWKKTDVSASSASQCEDRIFEVHAPSSFATADGGCQSSSALSADESSSVRMKLNADANPIPSLETIERSVIEMNQRLDFGWIGSQWSDLLTLVPNLVASKKTTSHPGSRRGSDDRSVSADTTGDCPQHNTNTITKNNILPVSASSAALLDGNAGQRPRLVLTPLLNAGDGTLTAVSNSPVTSRHTSLRSFRRHKSQRGVLAGNARRVSQAARDAWEQQRFDDQLNLLEEEHVSRTQIYEDAAASFASLTMIDFYDPFYDDAMFEKMPMKRVFTNTVRVEETSEGEAVEIANALTDLGDESNAIAERNAHLERMRLVTTINRSLCICWVKEFEERKDIFVQQKGEWNDLIASQSPFSSYFSRRVGVYEASQRMLAAKESMHATQLLFHKALIARARRDSIFAIDRLLSQQRAELLLHMARWVPQLHARERLELARIVCHHHPYFLPFSGPHHLAHLAVWFRTWFQQGKRRYDRQKQRRQVIRMAGEASASLASRYFKKLTLLAHEGSVVQKLSVLRFAAEDKLRLRFMDKIFQFHALMKTRREQRRQMIVMRSNVLTELTSRYLHKWRKHNRSAPNRARLTSMMIANANILRYRYLMEYWPAFLSLQQQKREAAVAKRTLKVLNLQFRNNAIVQRRYFAVWFQWAKPLIVASTERRAAASALEDAELLAIAKRELRLERGEFDVEDEACAFIKDDVIDDTCPACAEDNLVAADAPLADHDVLPQRPVSALPSASRAGLQPLVVSVKMLQSTV